MKFRYSNLTPGYLGIKHDQLTLNSSFYAEFFGAHLDLDTLIIVPQRVVVRGIKPRINGAGLWCNLVQPKLGSKNA